MLTSEAIKRKARELGFDLCGVAPAESFPELEFLDEWLARGYAGDMTYLSRSAARRADVRAVVPGARSVIVTGTVYNAATSEEHSATSDRNTVPCHEKTANSDYNAATSDYGATTSKGCRGDTAIIARYAWGDDYHDVLKARLDALVDWMRETSSEPFDARAYVDTGPVQERVYAQYAGLGWIGKNTCLINPELGSWLFLAEVICTLPLEPDTQGLEMCGSCRRCLDACPTDALVEPGVLDSNKCLSYLTIELRSAIPEAQRSQLGAHVYGCDICQEVCPYNQPSAVSDDRAWQPRPGLDLPRLVDLWRRPDESLRALIRHSAMTRAKLTGLRRNLAVAIGNSGDAAARAALMESRADQPSAADPMVAEHVAWAQSR